MSDRIKFVILIIILLIIGGFTFGLNGYMEMYITIALPGVSIFLIIISIPLIIPYVLGIFSAKRSTLSKDDFKKNEQYYREIIKYYSPACLSYIDDFEIGKEVIVATLLSLKLKNRIQILEDKIIVVNRDITGLSTTEINILNSIKNRMVEVYNFRYFKQLAQEEVLNAQLITNEKPQMKGSILIWVIVILIFLIGLFIDYLMAIGGGDTGDSMAALFVVVDMIILTIYYTAQENYSHLAKVRTSKGNEMNKKLEGLKQYIKKYSSLDEKNSEFINIWEEYLIYSVIFKQNRKIVKELERFIKTEKEVVTPIFK